MNGPLTPRSKWWTLLADVAVVVSFVAIGRRNHDEDFSFASFVGTLAPFLVALACAWIIGRIWSDPVSKRSGAIAWVVTIVLGMVLRRFVFDDGTATAFVIVATVYIGALANGWRALFRFRAGS